MRTERANCTDTLREQLLDEITRQFLDSPDFNGLVISRYLEKSGASWPEVKAALAGLVQGGQATLNFAEMNPFVKNFPDPPSQKQLELLARSNSPGILCAYPTACALGDAVNRFADRPFAQMLAAGHGHLGLLFFDLAVLEMYAADPRYHFEFRSYSGWISIHDEFYFDDGTRERDKVYLKSFGLAYDSKGHRVLAAYLTDLVKLSPEHQQYWRTKQLTEECRVIKEYIDNTLGGIWVDTSSFHAALLHEQSEINKLCLMVGRPRLFRETFERHWPPGYSIFFRPTKRNFLNFVHTLDKILSDNLNKEFFEGDVSEHETIERADGTRELKPLGTLTLLKNWLAQQMRFNEADGLDRLMKPLREVRDLRSRHAHQLLKDEFDHAYHAEQDRLIVEVYYSLASLRRLFATHPDASGYQPPDFLDPEKLRLY